MLHIRGTEVYSFRTSLVFCIFIYYQLSFFYICLPTYGWCDRNNIINIIIFLNANLSETSVLLIEHVELEMGPFEPVLMSLSFSIRRGWSITSLPLMHILIQELCALKNLVDASLNDVMEGWRQTFSKVE